ncbi:YtfJ family protein [Enterovibrio paralichthyis]|uniref:YtfJ family protein n=1 Tax=Enterovibrio paralichthyis TaxID=2853805 RepID=UPI001C46A5B3|nr:YtfJ family protein [Enterovibrio paralichthyis]MBV7298881.1 YtfJ family protein [Enterovibrio paralichthyis]
MRRIKTLALATALISTFASANNITNGQALPEVSVEKYGELILNGDKIAYQAWDTDLLPGKVRVIQAIAGRSSAKEMNAPLMDAILAANPPRDKYQTTTIINQDDAIWGTGGFVKSSAEDSKKEFSWSSLVLDADGRAANAWNLKEESSAIIVLNKDGKAQFVKEGALSQDEIAQVIDLINKLTQ